MTERLFQPVVRELYIQRLSDVAVLKVQVGSQTDTFLVDLNKKGITRNKLKPKCR